MTNELDQLLTGAAVARRWRISRERLRQLAKTEGFPQPIGRVGNYVVWRVRDLERFEQAPLEARLPEGVVFRTIPHRPGFLEIEEGDGRQRGAVAWPGSRLVSLEPVEGGVRVATSRSSGVISKNYKGSWTLSPSRSAEDVAVRAAS